MDVLINTNQLWIHSKSITYIRDHKMNENCWINSVNQIQSVYTGVDTVKLDGWDVLHRLFSMCLVVKECVADLPGYSTEDEQHAAVEVLSVTVAGDGADPIDVHRWNGAHRFVIHGERNAHPLVIISVTQNHKLHVANQISIRHLPSITTRLLFNRMLVR